MGSQAQDEDASFKIHPVHYDIAVGRNIVVPETKLPKESTQVSEVEKEVNPDGSSGGTQIMGMFSK